MWEQSYSPKYQITERSLRQHLFDDPHILSDGTLVNPNTGGWVSAKVPQTPPAWASMPTTTGWIGALASPDRAEQEDLLTFAETALRAAGIKTVLFGGDPRHLYPGVPQEELWLARLLAAHGFEPCGEAWDLWGGIDELSRTEIPASVGPATVADEPALKRFLEREFPGRWMADTLHRLEVEDDPSFAVVMREGDEIVAFTHASHTGQRFLQPNLHFHCLQHPNPGGIGPVGVAASHRGQGLGRVIMEASIEVLRQVGVSGICVDWTGLLDFYGLFGFKPYAKYLMFKKDL